MIINHKSVIAKTVFGALIALLTILLVATLRYNLASKNVSEDIIDYATAAFVICWNAGWWSQFLLWII